MKKVYFFILLAFGTAQVFSQNITVYPSYPPTAICDGDQVTLTINSSILGGKTLAYYKFWADSVSLPGYVYKNLPNTGTPTQAIFYSIPPGVYTAQGLAVATDSTHISAGTVTYTVYYRPVAEFSLTTNSLDTQCLNGNSFCLVNSSRQNPLSPSNPIASCFWNYGDGNTETNCSPLVCHSYAFVNTFSPILTITDDHGCQSIKYNPNGHDSTSGSQGVTVVASANPNFSWVKTTGYCFQTCYKFRNLSPLTIDKVKHYQWDFGDRQLCDQWWEPDSTTYSGTIPYFKQTCDSTLGISDSTHYDTITHCYCQGGSFSPKLSISNIWGCTDSLRKTASNSGGIPIPSNINFTFDVTTTTQTPNGTILADSVCVGSGNQATICYKQTEILGVYPGGGGTGFIWDFGDPNDPQLKNFDSMQWQPCHLYSGMGSFFPSLTVQCHPDTTFYYFTAKVVGPYRRFIDTTYDNERDLLNPQYVTSTVNPKQIVTYTNRVFVPGVGLLPANPAFDGQAMIINAVDSIQLKFDTLVYDTNTRTNFAKYKMVYRYKYFGDTAYYFNTQPFTSPYAPYPTIRPDSIPVYRYWWNAPRSLTNGALPLTNFFIPAPIYQTYQTIQDSILPISMTTGLVDVKADSCLNRLGLRYKPYYYNSIVDANNNLLNTFWYKFARSYNYGVRVLGPSAKIENPQIPSVIIPSQKQQCGPDDTVDFVNNSSGFKSRNIWRQWNFGDVYAPQCTSFSVPHFPHDGMYSWPPVVRIDSFAYYAPKYSDNDYLRLKDTLIIMYDTIRMWSDAVQQYMNSDHFFINNGVTYQGKRNCNYSHDTLPRHVYPNWDSVFLWYRYGHDFMPWKKTINPGGYMFSDTVPQNTTNIFANKPWDTTWWGKPVYLNILTGAWSLWQDSSLVTSYVDTTYICNYFTFSDSALNAAGIYTSNTNIGGKGKQHFYYSSTLAPNCRKKYITRDIPTGKWVKWPRIDTLNQNLPAASQLPRDIWPGNSGASPKGITPGTTQIPDPFQMGLGNYTLFSGITIDTVSPIFPPRFYTLPNGTRITLPDGNTLLPNSSETFFEYMFRRVIQKCITVTLTLSDSLNNESKTSLNANPGYPNDGDTLDMWDCNMTSTVQLALGKPDARGMGKQPKECPGLNGQGTQGYPALTFNDKQQPYPGFKLECGNRTSIWVDIDSLADRMDNTPCYLDGFTSWGQGTFGTALTASSLLTGNLLNITPGGLVRNTFYSGMNWSLFPPSPWGSADGTLLQYHMGANAGTPPAADSLIGYVTIGVFIGNGLKDTTLDVWKYDYDRNLRNDGSLLRDTAGNQISWNPNAPGLGNPWTYQNFLVIDQIANKTTPPPVPIPNGWIDDSLTHTYAYNGIIKRVPQIRYTSPTIIYDTMLTLQYIDPNWSRCMSDTVWYHNFWRIKELNAAFGKSPVEISIANPPQGPSYLREVGDTIWVMYADSVQDSVKNDIWDWGDFTITADSFYFLGRDTSDGYFVHGVRRTRYNFDISTGTPVVIDSLVWPCGVYGTRQFNYPVRYYKRYWDSIGFIAPDIMMLRNKCTEPNHSTTLSDTINVRAQDTINLPSNFRNLYVQIGTRSPDTLVLASKAGLFPDTIRIRAQDTTKLPPNYMRFFYYIGTASPDTLILQSRCPNPNHSDSKWGKYGYTNYMDTLFMPAKDTMRYTQFVMVDTSLMQLPLWHIYQKTSWEVALERGLSVNNISVLSHFMTNSQNCQYNIGALFTVGIIDTLHIYGGDWVEDTIFCKNEQVHFIDSLRYWRYDNTISDNITPNYMTSRPNASASCTAYHGFSYAGDPVFEIYQFDTIDFWARDSINPSDTLTNGCSLFSASQMEFRYFPGKWTNYDGNLAYLPPAAPLTGHWDVVLRGGSTKVLIPTGATDKAFENVYPGMVVFVPVTTPLGGPGLYSWNQFGYWEPCFAPIITFTPLNTPNYDTLQSLTDLSRVPIPTLGRTIIYNNGKGTYKKSGMYYWGGSQWIFISDNQYTTFPFYTHRVFWNFGDGTPIVMSTKPAHQYQFPGRFKVSMISRDSIGHFDTAVAFVEVMRPVANISTTSSIIGCKDTASFFDSSFVVTGVGDTNTLDYEVSRNWWFTIKYSYPNGLQGQDTIIPNSVIQRPTWYFTQKGLFKIKLAIITSQGCKDTTDYALTVQGPRPAFKFFSDTIGCKPFRVGILNMADSFGMRNPSDTPTLTTIINWGDGVNPDQVTGRRDTVWHTYTDTGTYTITAIGKDALPLNNPSCPLSPAGDTIRVTVKQPYYAKETVLKDTVCVGQPFDIQNLSDSTAYLAYRFQRSRFDSAAINLTLVGNDSIYGNAPDRLVKFDSVALYQIILYPTTFQTTVPLTARCAMTDTITIRALKPKAIFTIDTAAYPLYKFTNKSLAADYYQWTVYQKDGTTPRSDGQKTVYPPDINYQYDLGNDTGSFKVCLVAYTIIPNYAENCNDTSCQMINNIYTTSINIPNVFTPNGDGSNDFFKIDVEGELVYNLTIFNRWGTKVFSSTDKNNTWNGKDNNNGADCAEGTYFYVFSYKLRAQSNETSVHGTVTLIR